MCVVDCDGRYRRTCSSSQICSALLYVHYPLSQAVTSGNRAPTCFRIMIKLVTTSEITCRVFAAQISLPSNTSQQHFLRFKALLPLFHTSAHRDHHHHTFNTILSATIQRASTSLDSHRTSCRSHGSPAERKLSLGAGPPWVSSTRAVSDGS